MYEGKIIADTATATPPDVRAELSGEGGPSESVVLGLLVLAVALPLLAVRVFAHLVARDVRRIGKLAGIVGGAVNDARR